MRGLSGLRVMITGAAGGIGRAVIDRLQAEGAVVMGVDMIDPPNNGLAFAGIADVTDGLSNTAAFSESLIGDGSLVTGPPNTFPMIRNMVLEVPGGNDPTPAACLTGAGTWVTSYRRGSRWRTAPPSRLNASRKNDSM